MSQQEEIVLWIDQRWKRAIEKHLNDETLQEHLENVLDAHHKPQKPKGEPSSFLPLP